MFYIHMEKRIYIGNQPIIFRDEQMFETWKSDYKVLEAAGGLVMNASGQFLFIQRLGKWDLPKGKMEYGEDESTTAVREIHEETGVTHLQNKGKITETYHTYLLNGQEILKVCHWFLFETTNGQELVPQIEEDITAINWFAANELYVPLQNTYENIKEVIRSAGLPTP